MRITAVSIRDLTCHFVRISSHLWSMNTHCIPVLMTSSLYILSSAFSRDKSSLMTGIVYHPKHFPLQDLAVYPTVLRVIAFAPIPFPFPDPAFCSTRIIRSTSALSTTATWPYGFFGVLSKNIIDPLVGTALMLFSTLTHSVPTKGEPVSHPLSADHENHFIGNQTSCANSLASATHWCANSLDSAYFFPIHLSNTSLVVILIL